MCQKISDTQLIEFIDVEKAALMTMLASNLFTPL